MASRSRDGLYKRTAIWWLRSDPVTGKPISTKCRDREAARLFRASRERQAADPAHAAAALETLADSCGRLIDAREALGKPIAYYEQKLGHWLRIFGDEFLLSTFGPEQYDHFVAERRREGASDHTIGKEVRCMMTVMRNSKRVGRWAGDLETLRPMDLSSDYVPRTRALSPAEVTALVAELEPRRAAFVALCVGLGLRRGEVMAMLPSDVDRVESIARVRGTKNAGAKREIPILAPFRGLVLLAAESLPLEPWGNYLRDLRAACRRAGIEPCTANDLRRTHATLLRSAKVDADTTRRLLGHTPGSTMLEAVYDKPTPRELAARAGDLAELTRQLPGDRYRATTLHCEPTRPNGQCESGMIPGRAPRDSNTRPTAPEAVARPATLARRVFLPGDRGLDRSGRARTGVGNHTTTLHSAGWGIALAAESVFDRRAGRPPVRKVARRAVSIDAFRAKARAWFASGRAA